MRWKTSIAAVGAVAAAAFAGAGHAAVVPIEQTLNLFSPQGSLVYNIATDGGQVSTASYYELVVDPSWDVATQFTTFATEPVATTAAYALYADTDASVGSGNTGAQLDSWSLVDIAGNNLAPFHTVVLGAGQYLLQVTTSEGQFSISSQITPVPLPGALWLFASAMLAFLGLCSRRRF
jgi:hypothetical protein